MSKKKETFYYSIFGSRKSYIFGINPNLLYLTAPSMKHLLYLSLLTLLSCQSPIPPPKQYAYYFDEPATYFEETLLLGNGQIGASIFGGVSVDSIYLNDLTLWSGEPVNPDMNPEAHTYIPAIREALFSGDFAKADSLQRFVQGSFSQSYAPMGTMYLGFDHETASDYRRTLHLNEATASVSYQHNGVDYRREYFVSHPAKLMAIRLTADQAGTLNTSLGFSSLLRHTTRTAGDTLIVEGYAPYHAEPSYRGAMPNAVRFDPDRGIHFANLIRVAHTDGQVTTTDSTLGISNASEAIILVSTATSFNGFDKDPVREGKDYMAFAKKQLADRSGQSFDQLRVEHLDDFQEFFNRVTFELDQPGTVSLPIDERLKRYARGQPDPGLEELYLHFGRYLLISSSRTPGVPANLQGIWNHHLRPPWSSNYTLNINLEENYWLAETANLSEMHQPLLGFIENLATTGAVTARNFYGVDRGWAVAHNSDIWAMSNPVGDFGQGHPVWANWNMGGTWLSTHLWEHYLFTQDRDFLAKKGYPLLKGAAEFCYDWMIRDKNGYWVTAPSTSPENLYRTPDGYQGATLLGATADLAMIRELFSATIKASEILDADADFRDQLQTRISQIHPYQIGSQGHLQEWYYDWEDVDPQHRHQTHLFGLHPGHHITPEETPELAEACRTTLNIKGNKSTGWSQGWRVNLWARLKDGNRAHKLYEELLQFVDPSGEEEGFSQGGGTYPNLLDAHPPFQIDGNFGGAAGVIEMLVQSSADHIELLPALPDAWPSGKLTGVKARGGFELSFTWQDGQVQELTITSTTAGSTELRVNGTIRRLDFSERERKGLVLGSE